MVDIYYNDQCILDGQTIKYSKLHVQFSLRGMRETVQMERIEAIYARGSLLRVSEPDSVVAKVIDRVVTTKEDVT